MYKNYTFLDLDGVILDSEERIINLREKNNQITWEQFFEEIDWFKLLAECEQINNSIEIIKELESKNKKVAILTKIHTLLEMEAKVSELRNNRKISLPILFVPPHIMKSQIYIPKNNEILIDDSLKNINDWNANGGNGILFDQHNRSEYTNKVKSLEFLLRE